MFKFAARTLLATGSSVAALAYAAPAIAQEAPVSTQPDAALEAAEPVVEESGALSEIVVTARRRAENLQDVPISITAFDGSAIERLGIQDTTDLEAYVPSLTVGSEAIFSVYPNYGIRGQRNDSFLLQQAPTVITYFAGAPQGHPAGFGNTLFDIASVQVLNGPQGTLFGKNSTGGAVVVEPNRPTDAFEGNVYASYGSFEDIVVGGVLNFPISDTVRFRVAAEHQESEGYAVNRVTGQGLGAEDSYAVRASLLWEPTPGSTVLTMFDYYENNGSPGAARLAYVNPNPSSVAGGSQLANRPALLAQVQAEFALQQSQRGNDRYNIASGFGTGGPADIYGREARTAIQNWGITNDISVEINDNLRIRNIASYRSIRTEYDTDYASGNYFLTSPASRQILQQFTEELQILGKAFNNRLNYVVGAFFFDERGVDDILALNFLSRRYNVFAGANTSYSAFAQGTFALTDNLSLTAGLRYNSDTAEAANRTPVLSATSPLFPEDARIYTACGVGTQNPVTGALIPFPLDACELTGGATYEKLTWTGSLEYRIPSTAINGLDRGLIYATARRGYRAGGFNVRATSTQTFLPYAPETVDDFEIGVKADWDLGGPRLRTNVAFFYDLYENLQRQVSVPVPGVPLPQGLISNAASARVYGLEFEMRLIPFRGFEIGGYYNYINAQYTDYVTVDRDGNPIDLSNQPFQRTPQHKFSINARYQFDLANDNGNIALSGAYAWRDDEIFEDTPLPNGVLPTQEAFGLLTARLEWNDVMGSGFDLAVYGRNLTNEYYMAGFADISTSLGVAVFLPGEPRSFGVQGRFRF